MRVENNGFQQKIDRHDCSNDYNLSRIKREYSMKKIILIFLLLPVITYTQYFGERTTDQSFEKSDIYFTSHFLNTYGIYRFKDVSVGMINDPFLNLHLNPSYTPEIGEKEFYVHLDFRGDRTEAAVVDRYIMPIYYLDYYRPYYDPRWLNETREEPEPIVSFGIINFPLGVSNKELFIGGTYQLILNEDKYYSNPYSIYNNRLMYDAFGAKAEVNYDVPIEDIYSGKDEMTSEAHLFSIFAGYNLLEQLTLGISMNGVVQSRDGGYAYNRKDEYGNTNNMEWSNLHSKEKNQEYDHLDFSIGLTYKFPQNFLLGIKAGILDGTADQNYLSETFYSYKYLEPEVTSDWSYSYSKSTTTQNWKHDGTTKYFGINSSKDLKNGSKFSWYYRYTSSEISTATTSVIEDSSMHDSKWYNSYNNVSYIYKSNSSMHDIRSGEGKRESKKHEGMFNFNWVLSESATVTLGVYFKKDGTTISNLEPVNLVRMSNYHHSSSNNEYNYSNEIYQLEAKTLDWNYEYDFWTMQIPLIFNFTFSDEWGMILGISRTLNSWKISDQTTAYFERRLKIENGTEKQETNFGERYTQPTEKITEDFFDVTTGFYINISPEFTVRLMLDPEFEDTFRIAQWWLSFNAGF